MIKVLFFAKLRDLLGSSELQLDSKNNPDVTSLLNNLQERGGSWSSALADNKLMVAVNQTIITNNSPLQDGDEVAFFPPVTGG